MANSVDSEGSANPVSPTARFRFFRVSLRSALMAVALIALLFSWVVLPSLRQRDARRWVESQRGEYAYDATYRSGDRWYTPRRGLPIPGWAIEWFGIDLFANVTVVGLQTDEIFDLQPLAGLTGMEELYINQFIHPEADFTALRSLKRLRKLELTKWSGVDQAELKALARLLPNVEILAEEFPEFDSRSEGSRDK